MRSCDGMEVIMIDFGCVGGCDELFAMPITSIFIRGCYLPYANFLSLRDKKLVIVSVAIPAHASGSREKLEVSPNKAVLVH